MPEIRVIHILRIWALLYNVLENYRKNCNVSLFSPSLQIQWFIQAMPRCCAAAWRGFNGRELNFHVRSHLRRNGQGQSLGSSSVRGKKEQQEPP